MSNYPVFPIELASAPLNEPFSYAVGSALVRTQMDAGAAKVRRKLTKPVDLISAVYLFTDAERDIFKAFVEDAIQGGSLPFQYQLCGGDYMLVRLVPSDENTLYTIQRESNRWSITVTLEVV